MADIEKAIKGLEYCTTHYNCRNKASNCPFIDDCKTIENATGNTLMRDALELLKEQEKKIGEWIYKHDNLWYCSRCGEIIYSETDDDLEIHHAYCSRCGAKMKQEGR